MHGDVPVLRVQYSCCCCCFVVIFVFVVVFVVCVIIVVCLLAFFFYASYASAHAVRVKEYRCMWICGGLCIIVAFAFAFAHPRLRPLA